MPSIKVLQMPYFKRAYKRLHKGQRFVVDKTIEELVKDPYIGKVKKGDLARIYVYKFKHANQEFLLAYEFNATNRILLALGVHENFYRDLKKKASLKWSKHGKL